MRVGILALAVGTVASLASLANADIIYSVHQEYISPGVAQRTDRVDYYNRGSASASTKLTRSQIRAAILAQNPGLPIADTDVRLADISTGANGEFLLTHGQAIGFPTGSPPQTQGVGAVLRLQNIQGVASAVGVSSGGLINNPIGVAYDSTTNSAVMVLNPGTDNNLTPYSEGIVNANYLSGAQTQIFDELPGLANPRPRYQAAAYIQPDPRGLARTFLVGSQQGGLNAPVGNNAGGPQLYRLNYDATLTTSTMSRIVDFTNPAETGIAEDFVDGTLDFFTNGGILGIAVVPGSDSIYVAMRHYGIWKVNLTAAGAYDISNPMTQILDPFDLVSPGDYALIGAMDYDPYANKLVFGLDNGNGVSNLAGLWEVNLDGSGANRLVADVVVRGIDFIPAPGAAALLGLGALVAGRRRRN